VFRSRICYDLFFFLSEAISEVFGFCVIIVVVCLGFYFFLFIVAIIRIELDQFLVTGLRWFWLVTHPNVQTNSSTSKKKYWLLPVSVEVRCCFRGLVWFLETHCTHWAWLTLLFMNLFTFLILSKTIWWMQFPCQLELVLLTFYDRVVAKWKVATSLKRLSYSFF
jgi:hypothetical protein